jgi:hypothetical protein
MTAITPLTKFMEPLHGLDPRRRTRIMAILNATPDSFSDGGKVPAESASKAIYDFKTDVWSTIIDVGGQSTAPGVKEVSADEETKRVVTTIEEITNAFGELSISVDIPGLRRRNRHQSRREHHQRRLCRRHGPRHGTHHGPSRRHSNPHAHARNSSDNVRPNILPLGPHPHHSQRAPRACSRRRSSRCSSLAYHSRPRHRVRQDG